MFLLFIIYNFIISTSFHIIYPRISIIIPIYNVNKYLRECLDSIINQTLKTIEIICVNDGSTDNSLEIIKEYIYDNRIIIINKNNSGYGDSMNQGLNIASGEYIGIVESDDFIDINMFENLYKITKKGDIDIIRSNFYLYWEKNKKEALNFKILKNLYNKIFNPMELQNIFLVQPSIWAGIYKKLFLIKNNIKFLTTPGASYQDTSFFYKTLYKANKIFCTKKAFYYYRQTNSNSSVNNNTLNKVIFAHIELNEIEKFIKKDIKLYNKNQRYFNTKKIMTLLWNLNRVDKKKQYNKILYKEIYEILKSDNYIHEQFNNFEINFLNHLKNNGEERTSEIFLYSPKEKNPQISVIIPIYNCEKYIKECLSSLIKQTFKNFEIICINDGSNDDTLKILKKFEAKDERINIFNQNNSGPGIARNVGMKKSKGEYLMFLDSDDIFKKTMLEELYIKIKENDSDIVICNSQNFEKKKWWKKFYEKNYLINNNIIKQKTFTSLDIEKDFFNLFIWWPWDKLFKRKYIENLGIEYQNLKSSEDLFFVAASVIAAKKISYLDKILINHRIGIKNSVSNSRQKSWDNFYYALKKLKKFIKEKGLYKRFKQDFINYVASFSIWQLENINGISFELLYKKIKNEWWNEFKVTKYGKNYFYNQYLYKNIKFILNSNLKQLDNSFIFKTNNIKFNYLKKQQNKSLQNFYFIKSFENTEKYSFILLNQIILIYFFIINFIIFIKNILINFYLNF
jgi:glycosyltransferase involved in cell wall biosynthesis